MGAQGFIKDGLDMVVCANEALHLTGSRSHRLHPANRCSFYGKDVDYYYVAWLKEMC